VDVDRVVQGLWIGLSLVIDAGWGLLSRYRFLTYFRAAASEGWNVAGAQPLPRLAPSAASKPSPAPVANVEVPYSFTRWWRRRPILASFAIFFAAFFLVVFSYRFWMRHKVDRYIAQMAARGQPLTQTAMVATQSQPRLPDDAAPGLRQAIYALQTQT